MAVQSGTLANATLLDDDADTTATKVIECTGWTMERTASTTTYASNSTNGNKRTLTGTVDCTGTLTGVYDVASPIEAQMEVGDRVMLQLHLTDVLGHQLFVKITGGPNYSGDINEGSIPQWTMNWAQDDSAPSFNTALVDANP